MMKQIENRCDICGCYMECKKESDTESGYGDIYFQCNNINSYYHKKYNEKIKSEGKEFNYKSFYLNKPNRGND